MEYTLSDKKGIMTRINNLKSKKHYTEIYKIIKENNVNHSQNINGVFINLTNIENEVLEKIVKYIDYAESRNTEIDSEFYSKVVSEK
jgi:hypothetical protein